jgi:hypothetical protein
VLVADSFFFLECLGNRIKNRMLLFIKAYNIDKLLEFLAAEKSVYMIYLVGIGERGEIITRLCSVFDSRLIKATMVQPHWAGRNSRGVAQFLGTALTRILVQPDASEIDHETATAFLQDLINT